MRARWLCLGLGLVFLLLSTSGCVTAADKKLQAAHEKMYEVNRQTAQMSLNYAKYCADVAAQLYVAEKALYDAAYEHFLQGHNENGALMSMDANNKPVPMTVKEAKDAFDLYQQHLAKVNEKRQLFLEVHNTYLNQLQEFAKVTGAAAETEQMVADAKTSAQAVLQQGLLLGGVVVGAAIAK